MRVALEWVQGVPWRIHVGRAGGRIQSREEPSEPVCVFWLNASLRAGFGKLLDAFVPIALRSGPEQSSARDFRGVANP